MAGNLPVTLTTFETELQAKINTVGAATSIEDIISYYRAGENIPTINNTALTDEVQLRLNAVSSSTTAEEFLTLAASFGKISNTNQSDLQSALLAIADIPTNSELATALNPIATSAELAPLAQSSELAPLATSVDVSDSEAAILSAISGGGGEIFKPTTLGTSQNYSLSASTSPLVLTPPTGKVIRLDTLLLNDNSTLADTYVQVGSSEIIRGDMRVAGSSSGTFLIGKSGYSSSTSNFAYPAAYKDHIVATQVDESISISTTDTTPQNVYYSVTYGDLV